MYAGKEILSFNDLGPGGLISGLPSSVGHAVDNL